MLASPLFYVICVGIYVSSVSAQTAGGYTQFATILPNFKGEILQYSFPVSPFSEWDASKRAKKFTFAGTNTVQVQTVAGVTQLYLSDSHDVCGPKNGSAGQCQFLGQLSGTFSIESNNLNGAAYQHVSGTFYGTFQDAKGNSYENVPVLLSFDTFPSIDGVQWPAFGGVTIVLQPNGVQ